MKFSLDMENHFRIKELMEALFFIRICFITGILSFLELLMVEFIKLPGYGAFRASQE